MNTLPVTHISCLYTVLDVLDIIQSLYSPSVEGSLVKSVGTKFKYYPHWCLNSPLPRACSLSGPHWTTIQAYPVPLDLIRLLLLGEEKRSPCSSQCFQRRKEGGLSMLHTPNSSMTVTFSEDTQGMEETGPDLLCLKATSPCLAVHKSLFQPLGTKAATTDQKSV